MTEVSLILEAKWYNGYEESADARAIRREVFGGEADDGLDALSMHVVLYDGAEPIAAGRVLWDDGEFLLDRAAVIESRRRQGIGDFLVRIILRRIFDSGGETQYVNAERGAVKFFEALGFEAEDDGAGGAPRVRMKRSGDIGGLC